MSLRGLLASRGNPHRSSVIARRAIARRGALSAQREEVPLGCNPHLKKEIPTPVCALARNDLFLNGVAIPPTLGHCEEGVSPTWQSPGTTQQRLPPGEAVKNL